MLDKAGYDGSPVVLLHPTDQRFYGAMCDVVAASLKKIGINFSDQAMDWGSVVQRRASKAPLDKGGWSLFCTSSPALDYLNPLDGGCGTRQRWTRPGGAGRRTRCRKIYTKAGCSAAMAPRPTSWRRRCRRGRCRTPG